MFQFFRINDPYRLIFVLLILVVLRGAFALMGLPISLFELKWQLVGQRLGDGFLMYKDTYDYTAPLSAAAYYILDFLFGRSILATRIISTFWLFLNASMFSILLVRNRAYKENNYLPALFFVLVAFAVPDFMSLSPQLMSITFVILALNNIFRRMDNEVKDEIFLYAGIYLGIAGLFYLPSIIFFGFFLLALLIFSTPKPRRLLLYLYGFLVPYLVIGCYYYWLENLGYAISAFERGLFGDRILYLPANEWWLGLGVPVFWALLAVLITFSKARFTSFESKISQVMLLMILATALIIWMDAEYAPSQFIFLLPAVSYYLTHFILLIKRRVWRMVLPPLLMISLVGIPFVSRDRMLELMGVKKSELVFTGKRIMVLGDKLNYYVDQRIAGPYIDPQLGRASFDHLDYYQTAYDLYKSIATNPPEVIIDDWQMMDQIFFRFPVLKEQYRAGTNNKYYLNISN